MQSTVEIDGDDLGNYYNESTILQPHGEIEIAVGNKKLPWHAYLKRATEHAYEMI